MTKIELVERLKNIIKRQEYWTVGQLLLDIEEEGVRDVQENRASVSSVRDVLVVLLGSALIRMHGENLTTGQTADLLLMMLDREGYEIAKKKG
jgi:hypothetical protein